MRSSPRSPAAGVPPGEDQVVVGALYRTQQFEGQESRAVSTEPMRAPNRCSRVSRFAVGTESTLMATNVSGFSWVGWSDPVMRGWGVRLRPRVRWSGSPR